MAYGKIIILYKLLHRQTTGYVLFLLQVGYAMRYMDHAHCLIQMQFAFIAISIRPIVVINAISRIWALLNFQNDNTTTHRMNRPAWHINKISALHLDTS